MSEELKEELKRLGADVRPGSELPGEVREMIEAYAPGEGAEETRPRGRRT
jgi:hypothetical protein